MNSRIIATCPQCNAQLAVGAENAGKRIRCPKCQSAVQVPDVEVAAPNPPVEVEAAPAIGSAVDRITTTCPKCSANLAVGVEKSGMRLLCPKCQAPIQVPDRSKDDIPTTTQSLRHWNVAVAGKKTGPFGKAELHALVNEGKLPSEGFIRDEDTITAWTQVATVPWLNDPPQNRVGRHCPECDCRVYVSNVAAEKRRRCPNCGVPVTLVDYLNFDGSPALDFVPAEPWGKFDIMIVAATSVTIAAGVFGAVSLLTNPPLAVLLGFIFLITGGGLFAVTFHHRSQTRKYRTHLTNVENELESRTESLMTAHRELNGLKRGLIEIRNGLMEEVEAERREQLTEIASQRKAVEEELYRKKTEIAEQLAAARHSAKAVNRMAERFLDETRKWWTSKLNGENFQTTKERIAKAIEFCRKHGHAVTTEYERELMQQLRADYEIVLRHEHEKGEQKRIREQMREEQRVERELKREMERIDTEKRIIEKALTEALKKVGAEHSAEVESLREKLREAEERGQRTQAQAELTKVGYVYVISNIGSFGENVFKVGLTRRLEPLDRVKELGDASVPFKFDVHMMIFSEDSPKLERTLHQALHKHRVNRVNFRKEFFRVELETIRAVVEDHHGIVEYVADAEALQYRQSLTISDEDFEYLAKVEEAIGVEDEDDDLEGRDELLPVDVE
jgi:hypothetical protein